MVKGVSSFPRIFLLMARCDCVATMKGSTFSVRSFGGALFYFAGRGGRMALGHEVYRIAFVGHREIYDVRRLEKEIEKIAKDAIFMHEFVEFYLGRNGEFDLLAASVLKRVQKSTDRQNSTLILVLPYHVKDEAYYEEYYDAVCYPNAPKVHSRAAITKRNEYMVDHAELLVAFVETTTGGAYTAMRYAEKRGVPIQNIGNFS